MDDDPSKISLSDWQRLLLGGAPVASLFEVLVRTVVIYVFLMFVLRAMGKRMGGQISNLELAVMVVLGAIVSMPMQVTDAGFLPSSALLICLLAKQRAVGALGTRSKRIEELFQGEPSILVKDGVIQLDALQKARISHWQLFSSLRTRGIRHLGQVKRVYLESGGVFSIVRTKHPRPGLCVLSPSDDALRRQLPRHEQGRACESCGAVCSAQVRDCPRCHGTRWSFLMTESES